MSAQPASVSDSLAGAHLVFAVNEARFLISHRLELLQEASRRGLKVTVICGRDTGEGGLNEQGVDVRTLPLTRSSVSPVVEWRVYRELSSLYRSLKPDICHHVTIKPVIYGTRAAQQAGVRAVVNAIPGMGFVFIRRGIPSAARRMLVNELYRVALRHPNMRVIFQNSEDLRGFVANGIVARNRAVLIRGSGVDLSRYSGSAPLAGPPCFVLVARMLNHKGVREFVDAARVLRAEAPDWRFQLVGDTDPGNPSSLTRADLERWQAEGVVEWLGFQSDVPALLQAAHVVVLPSYREGLPKTLLEASAAARPIIATDVPGCREVVREGMNGLLVPARDADALAGAMRTLGHSEAERLRMGLAGRVRAEALYSIDDVVRDTFLVYQQLLDP